MNAANAVEKQAQTHLRAETLANARTHGAAAGAGGRVHDLKSYPGTSSQDQLVHTTMDRLPRDGRSRLKAAMGLPDDHRSEPSLARKIGSHISENFKEAFAEPLGPSAEFMRPIDEMPWYMSPVQLADNAVYRVVGSTLDFAARTLRATYDSAVDGAVDVGASLGLPNPEQARRDFKAMPEAVAGSAGSVMRPSASKSSLRERSALPVTSGKVDVLDSREALTKTGNVKRINTYPTGVEEFPISKLNPIHDVPRNNMPEFHIDDLAKSMIDNGFDVTRPISGTKLPNGDLIVTGWHHRLAAMKKLGAKTVPVKMYDGKNDHIRTARYLGIGRTTGKYTTDYLPELNAAQKKRLTTI